MEPMLICALGIVIYCGCLTLKDFAADLRQEGLLVTPISARVAKWSGEVLSFCNRLAVPQNSGHANRFILLPCRTGLPSFRQAQAVRIRARW